MLIALLAFVVLMSGESLAAYQRTADNTVPAYTDSNLRNRQGNERVDRGDVVTVFQETSGAYYVRYPTPNGTKDRWVPKNIFNGGNNVNVFHPSEGDYFIVPESNGAFALDVKGGGQAAAGTPIWLYQKNDSDAQIFTIRRVNGDWYKLVHKRTGLVINVQRGNDSDRTQMWLYQDDGSDSCYWRFIDAGNGSYIIQSKLGSNRVFDLNGNNAYNGATVQLWSYHTNQAAHWKLVSASTIRTQIQKGNGDVNGDGRIDSKDSDLLRNYLVGNTTSINKSNADINGDGEINVVDLAQLSDKIGNQTQPTQNVQRQAKQTVPAFTNSSLSNRTGNERVDAGDMVTVLQEANNAYLVRYPTSNGTKDRWVSKDIFSDPPPVPAKLQELINRWNNQTWRNHTYLSNVKECKEFASFIFNSLYGVGYIGGGSTSDNPKNYLINLSNPNRVGLRDYKINLTANSARELFAQAQAGDFVQIRRRHGGPHSGIFVNRTGDGIVLFEANADGKNSIRTNTYSYSDLANKNYAMSLYYAK